MISTKMKHKKSIFGWFAHLLLMFWGATAFGQGAVLQGGPWVHGHSPMYVGQGSSQAIVQDSGSAGGAPTLGVGLSEQLLTVRNPAGVYPAIAAGSGPYGSNWCDYDAPLNNPTGYHFICLSPNPGKLIFGYGGAASPNQFTFNINGSNYDFPFAVGGIVGPNPSQLSGLTCWNNTIGTLLKDCTTGIIFPLPSVAPSAYVYSAPGEVFTASFRNTNLTGTSIYGPLNGGTAPAVYDNVQSVLQIPSGTTLQGQLTGFAAYYRNQASQAPGPGGPNAVGLFTAGTCEANSSFCWGINTLIQDAANRAVGSQTGTFLQNEFDFNVMNTGTSVFGLSVGGNSLSQPMTSIGYVVNSLGSGIKWGTGFSTQAGTANVGLFLAAASNSGSSISSQPIELGWINASAVSQVGIIQMAGSYLQVSSAPGTWNGLLVTVNAASSIALTLQNTSGTCAHTPTAGSETVACSSDERLKSDIKDTGPVLPYVRSFRIRDYTVKADGSHATGVIAQETRVLHPEMVHDGDDGFLRQDAINPWIVVKAVQELNSCQESWKCRLFGLR